MNSTKGIFIIPSEGNTITEKDIEKNQLRITVDFKKYFPVNNCDVKAIINDVTYHARFTYRDGRSHTVRFDESTFSKLGLKSGDHMKITRIADKTYKFEKYK